MLFVCVLCLVLVFRSFELRLVFVFYVIWIRIACVWCGIRCVMFQRIRRLWSLLWCPLEARLKTPLNTNTKYKLTNLIVDSLKAKHIEDCQIRDK